MPKATIDDVAELAGVSIKTVSRVVNREPNVRPATKEKVDDAIAQLNYRPNPSARNLASQRSYLVVLVYDDPGAYEVPSFGYVLHLQKGALRACRKAGYELVIHPCNYRNDDVEAELTALIQQARPDGVIIAAPLSNMPKIVKSIGNTNTPFVRMAPGTRNGKEFSVATDDRQASAEMTEYLASLGHQRIAFITGHPSHKAVTNRFDGYKDGLKNSGLTFSEQLVIAGDNSIGTGEAAAKTLLTRKNPPTAIFAANDDMAAGVIRMANKLGIKVPGDVSVAGFDDTSLAQQIYPSLTTVRQPLELMAECAADAIIKSGKDNIAPGTEIITARMQLRESTGPAPG